MSSPLLWGPNNTASNLQNQVLQANGSLLAYDGAKNYISYGNFENSLTTGWSLGTIGTLTNGLPTGSPTFGSGASGNLSIATTSSANIEGLYSLQLISSAATTQGNMLASQAYSIDVEDQAKVMTVKFYYQATSGASNCNFSGTSSNSFAWAIYDVTNSSWLTSAGNFNLVQNNGCGYVTGTCQTNSNTSQLRLVVYNANATSGAATLTLDGFYVGPQTAPIGPAVSDWVTYTPTVAGSGGISNVSIWYKRIGDTLLVRGVYTVGTVTGTSASISLPSVTIDSTKFSSATATQLVGIGNNLPSSAAGVYTNGVGHAYFYDGSDTNNIYIAYQTNTHAYQKIGGSSLWSSGDTSSFQFSVPIAGWSSNSVASSDTDTRVCAFQAYLASNYAAGANAAIKYDTVLNDTHAGYSTSTGLYTVPVSGYYRVSVIELTASSSGTPYLAKNGSAVGYFGVATSNGVNGGSQTVKCNAGDTLAVYSNVSLTWGGSSAPYTNMVSIDRLTGPAVVTATESVNGRYYSSSTSISSSLATIVYATKGWDTHGAYNSSTGIWTAPVSGKYQFNCALATAGTLALNSVIDMQVQQSGSSSQISEDKIYAGGVQTAITAGVSDEFYCLAGDTIKVQVSSSATSPSIVSSNNQNYFSWSRIGN
jgi:hypothetical protein